MSKPFMYLPLVELVRLAEQDGNELAAALVSKLYAQDESLKSLVDEKIERVKEKFDFFIADAQESLEEKLADPDIEDKTYLVQVFCNELKNEFPRILWRELKMDIAEILKAQTPPVSPKK